MRNTFLQSIFMGLPMLVGGQLLLAQSKNVGIGTTTPKARLHVSDSSVLFSALGNGPANAGNPPTAGDGRRLLWYADKGAFRAGFADAIDDRKDSIGVGSVGLGPYAKAKGESSVALGNSSAATAPSSFAIGTSSTASGDYATAIGYNSIASGQQSIALGIGVQASGAQAMAFGGYTNAPSAYETVMGIFNRNYTPAAPNGWAPTDRIFSIGIGQSPEERKNALTVLKNGRTGIGTSAPLARLHVSDSSVLFSAQNDVSSDPTDPPISGAGRRLMWYADKAAFRAGYVSGTQWDNDFVGNYSVAIGKNATAGVYGSIALGIEVKAMGGYGIALGFNGAATGEGAVMVGYQSNAKGDYSAAYGADNQAVGNYSLALGNSSKANGAYDVAMGFSNIASGGKSVALGSETKASAVYAMSAGYQSIASGNSSNAIGAAIEAPSSFETVLGVFNAKYVPASSSAFVKADRLFSIGNGTAEGSRSNALTILKNGNMGIGTTAPHAELQFSNAAVNRKIVLYEQDNNDHQFYGLGVNGYVLRYQINDVASSHIFYAGSSASTSNELMRIQGNGRVGIGTTAPDQLLTVNGNASKPGGGTWATFSDGRLKKNVADYTAGLDEILAIHPVSFQYNELSGYTDTDARYVGIIAQEMEKVLPATISVVEGDDKVKGKRQFDGSELTYTLVNAIKQEHAQVETLRKENEALKARLAAVEKALGIR